MARPKRKAADSVESTAPTRSKRHATTSRTHQEPVAKRRKTPKRACKQTVKKEVKQSAASVPGKRNDEPEAVDLLPYAHPAATFKPPNNPRATFEGLPAELRVMIYELASQSTMIHVHMHLRNHKPISDVSDFADGTIKFSWTPCWRTNPKSPLLCANPKWSGMCKEEDRCTHKLTAPPEPRGFWALIACSKAIRREAKAPCLRNTVISIGPCELGLWFYHLSIHAPSHIQQIRRITIAGPDKFSLNKFAMSTLQEGFPNLVAVGYQCQSPFRSWTKQWRNGQWTIPNHAWRDWPSLFLVTYFDPSVEFALEAMVWRHPKNLPPSESERPEHMTAIRVFGQGTKDVHDIETLREMDLTWQTETVDCSPLPEPKRNAMWRTWWRGKDAIDFSL